MTFGGTDFSLVYREHSEYVLRAARRLGIEGAEADDVCQEVFVVVHRRLNEFEGRSSIRTWLRAIVRHVVQSNRRSFARREAKHETRERFEIDALVDPGRFPEESASLSERLRLAKDLLAEVDEEKRPLVILVDVEEMSVNEAADALQLNRNTASSRLRAGRRQVAAALSRHRARTRFSHFPQP